MYVWIQDKVTLAVNTHEPAFVSALLHSINIPLPEPTFHLPSFPTIRR